MCGFQAGRMAVVSGWLVPLENSLPSLDGAAPVIRAEIDGESSDAAKRYS